jgi:hypothetical protein
LEDCISEEEVQNLEDALGAIAAAEIIRLSQFLAPADAAELRKLELNSALKRKLVPTSTDQKCTDRALSAESTSYFFNLDSCCRSPLCQRGAIGADQLKRLKNEIFGDNPHECQRRERYYELLRTAWTREPGSHKFIFYIGPHRVCERAFRVALGIHGEPSRMWWTVKRAVKEGWDPRVPVLAMEKLGTRSKKIEFIKGYIRYYARTQCDILPINDKGEEKYTAVVPFLSVADFKREFQLTYPKFITSVQTFRRALSGCPEVKLMRCKGNFSKCSVCQTAADMLANTNKKLTTVEREV